jgi:uncharacterized protein involved in response to NO
MKEAARVRLVSSSLPEQQPQANGPARLPAAAAQSWRGPAILSHGFRPFFLSAGVWALIGIAVWFLAFDGAIKVPTAFSIVDWHAHEMIFGYTGAVIAGFLLTAIPNWTGRLPIAGAPLAGLVALWAAGRVAIYVSTAIGRFAAGAIDVAFLVVFTGVVAAEVIAGRNGRNAKVVAVVAALALANIAFHMEDARTGLAEYSTRGALAFIVTLILLIGGRVTPSFTNNWLAKATLRERPVPFSRADSAVLAGSGLSLAAWIAAPESAATGALLLTAGLANLWRLSRWRGLAARRDALVLVLHAGYFFAALGFVAAGAAALWPGMMPYAVGVHVWAIGGAGVMTLAMMTRATLGHSGRALIASRGTRFAYACLGVALIARAVMAIVPRFDLPMMHIAAIAWIAGFAAFLFAYGPMLVRRRAEARNSD